MARRLTPQLNNVKTGDELVFIRNTTDCDAVYLKTRKAYVIEAAVDSNVALVAFVRPLRNLFNQPDKSKTFKHEGFAHCRWINKGKLIENCRKVRRKRANKTAVRHPLG